MWYLDISAFLKLLVQEEHSDDVAEALAGAELWSSLLLEVEAHRAAIRLGLGADHVDGLLEAVNLVQPGAVTFHLARTVGTAALRTLDALHLATAMEIGEELDGVVTYDRRLAEAADALGLDVRAPGRPERWWA